MTWYKDDVGPIGESNKAEASIKNNYVTLRPQYLMLNEIIWFR